MRHRDARVALKVFVQHVLRAFCVLVKAWLFAARWLMAMSPRIVVFLAIKVDEAHAFASRA